ncbi:MAG: hypothetical protein ACSLFH_10380, partial [Desulfuromonadales bacterium]
SVRTGHISPLSWSIERLLTFKIDKICPRPAEFSLGFPKSDRLLAKKRFLAGHVLAGLDIAGQQNLGVRPL